MRPHSLATAAAETRRAKVTDAKEEVGYGVPKRATEVMAAARDTEGDGGDGGGGGGGGDWDVVNRLGDAAEVAGDAVGSSVAGIEDVKPTPAGEKEEGDDGGGGGGGGTLSRATSE